MSYSLVLEDVNKSFAGKQAVRDLSLAIPEGSIYGFLGPNGAGKTTTIRMIMSIIRPDSGRIELLSSTSPLSVKDRLGYLPEEKGLYKKMKTRELIAYFGRLKHMQKDVALRRADEVLEQFGLGEQRHARCDTLSKGMGQKVQILATLLHDPDFVILDEPFSGLDPINIELVRQLILDLKASGKTVIFSTHIMEQAEQLCDYVLLINGGQKLIDGPLDEVRRTAEPTLTVEIDGEPPSLEIEGVSRVNNMGRRLELSLANDADPQAILSSLMQATTLRSFAIKEPSLHEIFVRTVGSSPE